MTAKTEYILPEAALSETFLAASGPGGQNVNKVATACQLRVDAAALELPGYAARKLKQLAGSKMTVSGEIIVTARSHRTREANREDARQRVIDMIIAALHRDPYRVKTRPSRAATAKRIEGKKKRGSVKAARGRPNLD